MDIKDLKGIKTLALLEHVEPRQLAEGFEAARHPAARPHEDVAHDARLGRLLVRLVGPADAEEGVVGRMGDDLVNDVGESAGVDGHLRSARHPTTRSTFGWLDVAGSSVAEGVASALRLNFLVRRYLRARVGIVCSHSEVGCLRVRDAMYKTGEEQRG
jgi:hypothetical protein